MDVLFTITAVLAVLATSIFIAYLIGLKSKISILLAMYLLWVANVILVTQIASLMNQLNNRWVVLVLHLLILLGVYPFWKKSSHKNNLVKWLRNTLRLPSKLKDFLRQHPLYAILAAGILVLTLFNAFIAIRVPPNTNDAMIQHLSRVGYWLQHGSLAPWSTPLILQVVYPPNAQLQMLWSILFTGVDRFVNLIQWFAIPVAALTIYGLTNRLGWSREKSFLNALLWLTLPEIVLQSTSSQNDLVSSALVVIALYFLYSGFSNQRTNEILLSSLSLALGLGTKQTVFLILPALGVIWLTLWWKAGKEAHKLLARFAGSTVIFFVIFGSYIYIQNTIHFKTPFGPSEVISETIKSKETNFLRNGFLKMGRVTYQSFDLSEIPYKDNGRESKSMWIYNQAVRIKAEVASRVFSWINLDLETGEGIEKYPQYSFSYLPLLQIQEDITWFGPMMFLMIPAVIVSLISSLRKKEKYILGLALIWLCLFVFLNFFKSGWTPNQSRYYVLSVTCTMPMVAVLWNDRKLRFLNYTFLGLGILFMFFTMLMNFCKPLIGGRSIWNKSDSELRGLQSITIRDSIVKIDDAMPENAIVGVALTGESFDYPLFGRHFTNIIIPANPIDQINDPEWLAENKICYVLVADFSDVEVNQDTLQVIESSPGWTLFRIKDKTRCAN